MRRAQDRARSATFKNSGARSATIESRALGALKLASEASCARSAPWECAREAGRFLNFFFHKKGEYSFKLENAYIYIYIYIYLYTLFKIYFQFLSCFIRFAWSALNIFIISVGATIANKICQDNNYPSQFALANFTRGQPALRFHPPILPWYISRSDSPNPSKLMIRGKGRMTGKRNQEDKIIPLFRFTAFLYICCMSFAHIKFYSSWLNTITIAYFIILRVWISEIS